jgi:hypothetical protein
MEQKTLLIRSSFVWTKLLSQQLLLNILHKMSSLGSCNSGVGPTEPQSQQIGEGSSLTLLSERFTTFAGAHAFYAALNLESQGTMQYIVMKSATLSSTC